MMNEFRTFHPVVNFIYYAFVIVFSMLLMHPAALIISFSCGFAYSLISGGSVKINLIYMLPVMIITAVLNPLFNHEGATILTYFSNDNPLTLESIVYGFAAALMFLSVICHFSNFNRVITSDKLMYLFGRMIPSLSLVISMTLRFVPRFTEQLRVIRQSQQMMRKTDDRNILGKLRSGIRILSIAITWALENSVDTADSMRSRGYGEHFRTSFSLYRFDRRDGIVLSAIILLGLWLIYAYMRRYIYFVYFPTFMFNNGIFAILSFAAYFFLCAMPVIIEIKEAVRWSAIK